MSWLAVVAIALGLWLVFKAVGLLVRLVLWVVILGALYWLIAPHLGLPAPF